MCTRVTCPRCKKYTYSGCGQHVNQVLAGIPKNQICDCTSKSTTSAPSGGLLGKILGRNK